MSSSSDRIKDLTNKTLLQRAQQREKEAEERARQLSLQLDDLKATWRKGAEQADEQLTQTLKIVDTLIEFIVLNHGDLPEKLVDIVAARQEVRIAKSLPGVEAETEATYTGYARLNSTPAASLDGQILRINKGIVSWVDPPVQSVEDIHSLVLGEIKKAELG